MSGEHPCDCVRYHLIHVISNTQIFKTSIWVLVLDDSLGISHTHAYIYNNSTLQSKSKMFERYFAFIFLLNLLDFLERDLFNYLCHRK